MNANLWQYLVLLEGAGAIGIAAGLAQEALRRDPFKLIGYANIGVLLICVSACANIVSNLDARPTVATWCAATGFGLYVLAVFGSWVSNRRAARRGHFPTSAHPARS